MSPFDVAGAAMFVISIPVVITIVIKMFEEVEKANWREKE